MRPPDYRPSSGGLILNRKFNVPEDEQRLQGHGTAKSLLIKTDKLTSVS